MIRQSLFRPMLAVLTAAALLLVAVNAPADAASKKAKKPAAARSAKSAKFIPGSQETARERATRLKRECKGRVNAGACEGYTE
jgi:hypothetical protein